MMFFAGLVTDPLMQENLGFSMILYILIKMAVNVIDLLYSLLRNLMLVFIKYQRRVRAKLSRVVPIQENNHQL